MYDVFILILMVVGITSLVVFSYKIFHSRVYAVGMVRKIPSSQVYIDEAGLPDFKVEPSELMSLLNKGVTNSEIARFVGVSEQDVKDRLQRMTWKVYAKRRLRSPQSGEKYRLHFYLRETASIEPLEDSPLEEEVVGHGEALKLHSKQFEDFEKRLRRLEIESVQKRQEATEEKPQPPQTVH